MAVFSEKLPHASNLMSNNHPSDTNLLKPTSRGKSLPMLISWLTHCGPYIWVDEMDHHFCGWWLDIWRASSHNLNQYWLIMNPTPMKQISGKLNKKYDIFHWRQCIWIWFSKKQAILFRLQCVKEWNCYDISVCLSMLCCYVNRLCGSCVISGIQLILP